MLFELKIAARLLRARPLVTSVAVATLAVGIGSNAAIFSVINAVLLRPLPYPRSEQLVSVYTRYLPSTGYDFPYFALSAPEFVDVRSRVPSFSAMAAYGFSFQNLVLAGGDAERVLTAQVTADFFDVLAVQPERGRTFTDAEAQRRSACVAIVGHDVARRGFPGGSHPIGATIRLDDVACEIVGVMPERFAFRDDRVKVWTGLAINAEETPNNRDSHGLAGIARVREGVAPQQVEAQLQALHRYWSAAHADHYAKGHLAVTRPLHADVVGDRRCSSSAAPCCSFC